MLLLITRGVVVASTVVAAFAELYLAEATPAVFWIALGGFALLVTAGSRFRAPALRVIMPAMYLSPAIMLALQLHTDFSKDIVWLLPLLGLCLSGGWRTWSLPARWQWPLITWAAIVSIAWPIVALREADFALWILPLERVSNTSIGIGPWLVDQSVAYFALGHNVGILFVDALCRWYGHDRGDRLQGEVLMPLAGAAAVACVVAFYQGFVDLSFLSSNFWTYMIRASGTLADPNKLGAVTAFWTIGAVAVGRRLRQPWSAIVSIAAVALGLGAAWLCGSRTGLAAASLSVVMAGIEAVRYWWRNRSSVRVRGARVAAMAIIALAIAAAMVMVLQRASTHTIVARGTLGYIPFIGDKGIATSANELLWERFGYGPAAIEMIKEHPIDGIGIGVFHSQSYDFGKVAGYIIPQPDNAQSWLRHHLAELGLIGSVPLLWWCWVVLRLMFRHSPTGDPLTPALLRGVLIAFFVASLFGMPAQSVAIVMTFWVFAYWLYQEKGESASVAWTRPAAIAAIALIAVHAGATTVDAFGSLRPRERAQRFDWYYRYGYHINGSDGYDREPDPGGNPIMRRWTMRKSLAVIPVKGKVLKFVAWVDHPDRDTRPVHTQVWADSKLVYEGDLRGTPLFLDIPAAPGKTHMVIETEVDRTFRPSDTGNRRDRRDLGLSIRDWTWE